MYAKDETYQGNKVSIGGVSDPKQEKKELLEVRPGATKSDKTHQSCASCN
jgi:hypothetical protein